MKIEIKIPALGESITEATVANILKPTGAVVAADGELLELETDKVNQMLYAPKGGQVSLSVKVGDKVVIGQVVGTIDTDVAAPSPPELKTSSARILPAESVAAPQPKKESVIDSSQKKRMSAIRRTIAQKLVEVKNTTALNYTFNEADMSRILQIRAQEKESFMTKYGVKLGLMSFFIKATVAALKAFPQVHAHIEGDDLVFPSVYDIGIAVSTERGLVVPVLRGCDHLNFGEVEKHVDLYAQKTREGGLTVGDLQGGSFTISNGGVFGSLLSTAIPPPHQSGILSMHNIVKRAVVIEDAVEIRPMMYLTLSYDHAVIDGREAILFLKHIKDDLEDPTRLLLDL